MIKRFYKIVLLIIMCLGITFSITNFLSKPTKAVMIDQLLIYIEVGDGYVYKCFSSGNGCHTVIEEPTE